MPSACFDLAPGVQFSDKWTDGVIPGTSHAEERHDHSPRKRSEGSPQTFIQVVLDDQDLKDDTEIKKEDTNTDLGYSPTILLSAFYVIIVSLVGVCFPIAEAIKGQWQVHHWVAAFMVYLYVVSTAFLLYVQIYHLARGKNSGQRDQSKSGQEKAKNEHGVGNLARPKNVTSSVEKDNVLVVRSRSSASLGIVNEAFDTHEHQQPQPAATTPGFTGPRTFFRQQQVMRNTSGTQPYIEKARRRSTAHVRSTADAEESNAAYVYLVLKGGTATLNHHGGASIYLKVGILLFSLANLLYTGLQIKYHHGRTRPCGPYKILYPYYFQMLFVVIQTFFVFKSPTVVIRNHKGLVRFGVMHVLATNLCTWLRFLVYEIMEAIHEANHDRGVHHYTPDNQSDPSNFSLHIGVYPPSSSDNTSCNEDSILKKAAPYLFPFILEYSLIAVAVMAGIYSSLNIHITPDKKDKFKKALRPVARKSHQEGLKGHVEGEIFNKSHLGIFLGFMLLAAIVVCIILFFYWNSKPDIVDKRRGDLVFQIADFGMKTIMMAATIAAMYRLSSFGFDLRRDNQIDHILLGVSLAGLFLNDLFCLISGFYKLSTETDYEWRYLTVLNVSCGLVTVIQGILQAIFIMDGLERFAETDDQVEKKPGRSLITFLIIANVICWIYQTVLEKKMHIQDELHYLGSPAWPIVQNLGLPLVVFFRFHSSICLAEMWHSAYLKNEEHMAVVEEHVSE